MSSATPVPITTDPERAGAAIAAGRLVGLPTETVYGLAADATNAAAVRAVFDVKERPASSPLIVHLAHAAQVDDWTRDLPDWARRLAEACWPGPLTLVATSSGRAASEVTAGGSTVAIRVPDHDVARAAIAASGTGVAAPSANRHGRVSPTRAEHVADEFDAAAVACVLDGGACDVGVESTIVDCTGEQPVMLRAGAITRAQVARVTGLEVVDRIERLETEQLASAVTPAPGQARSHYAPRARVELLASAGAALARRAELVEVGERCVLVLGDVDLQEIDEAALGDVLVATRQADQFARELYGALRSADAKGAAVVLAVAPPGGALADATLDRLQRAAAPRSGPGVRSGRDAPAR
jgi:L-threonylcarbamoyladenylate synthase